MSNIQYGENVNTTFWGTEQNEDLLLDVYLPTNDSQNYRPLIIFLYGGSFISGSKESPDIVELCMRYAKMGYVSQLTVKGVPMKIQASNAMINGISFFIFLLL